MIVDFINGLWIALAPINLLYCFAGVLVGTLVGVLPGLGPVPTLAMLLPLTFFAPPTSALIMLAGIYYGAQYGGSTTAILVNLPGENSSVVTCLDGYQMARKGRGGPALAIVALASLFAGVFATFFIAALAPPLANVALYFSPADYFSLMVLGLVTSIVLAHGSVLKAFGMIALGLLLSLVGVDVNSGDARMILGITELRDGIGFVPLAMGLFAVAEILKNLEQPEERSILEKKVTQLWPSKEDFRRSAPAAVRGTFLGCILGLLPGGGAMLSSFAAYTVEKRLSRTPELFGTGVVEGVAAPEAANNAGAQTSFIPLLTLGIPANPVIALVAGAMTIQGIQPGPEIMTRSPDLFWGLVASMLVGNAMLVVINLPLVGIWVRLLAVPYRLLYPALLVFCCIGAYSLNNSMFDVLVLIGCGLLGYFLMKWRCEPAPLLLAFVLGPLMEEYLRRALLLSRGDGMVFLTSPVSLCLLLVAAIMFAAIMFPFIRKTREKAFIE